MRPLYEYRPIGRPGIFGALVIGVVGAFGLFFEPAALGASIEAQLSLAAAFGLAIFLFVFLVVQRFYWAIDDDGISWRGRSMQRRRVEWPSLARVRLVWRGFGSFRGRVLELERKDGKRILVRPSRRYTGNLEPEAVELLEVFAARHGFELGWQEPEPAEPDEEPAPEPVAPLPGQTSLF